VFIFAGKVIYLRKSDKERRRKAMRRMTVAILCMFVVMLLQPLVAWSQDVKIGYIDTVNIFAEFKETVEAEEIYKKELDQWKKEAAEMEAEIAQLREELQSQSLMLSEEKLAEKKLILEQKYRDYQQYMNDIFGDEGAAAKRNQELTAPIVEKINAVITQIAEEEGYTIIFDAAQGNIVYAKKAIDLTERVLERLQAQMETVE
jgi:outer membrane protein